MSKSNQQYIKFRTLPIGTTFYFNGNEWKKVSTKTAYLMEYSKTFYIGQDDNCVVGLYSQLDDDYSTDVRPWRNIERVYNVAYRSLFRLDSDLSYARTIEAITKLAELVNDYDGDINWELGWQGECTLDSLLVGAYWYHVDCHGGQSSIEYAMGCCIGRFFKPNMTSLDKDNSEYDVYRALVDKHNEYSEFQIEVTE